jgi:hypothetical protein
MCAKNTLKNKLQIWYASSNKDLWKRIIGGLVIVFSFVYLGGILVRNWSELSTYELKIEPQFVFYAFLIYSAALWLAVLAWNGVVKNFAADSHASRFVTHLKYYVYSRLLQRLPVPLLYILGRSQMYEQEGIARSVMITISVIEWLLLIISGIFVCILLLPFVALPLPPILRTPVFMILLIIGSILLLHPKFIAFVFRLLGKEKEVDALSYRAILLQMLAYSAVWVIGGMVLFYVIRSIHNISITQLPLTIGMWVVSGVFTTAVFAVLPGFGSKEVTLALLLGYILQQPIAVVVALLMRFYLIIFDLVWAGIALSLL